VERTHLLFILKPLSPTRKEKKTIFSSQGIALQNMKVATDDCGHVGFTILLEQKYENDGDEVKCEVKCLVVE
jgi:hypothetical protein